MAEIIIKAEVRSEADQKNNKLRAQGKIPAVIYGSKTKTTPLVIDYSVFEKAYNEAGESIIIMLELDGKTNGVLVKEVQYHPVTNKIIHADLFEVDMSKKITTNVPLEFFGEAKAVKDDGGTLVTSIDEIEVECLPADLPKSIEVDISPLASFEDVVKIKDLNIPKGVEVLIDTKEVVATVAPPRSEEELKELEEEVKEEVENVEGVEKEEEEMEATESEAAAKDEKKDEGKDEGKDENAEKPKE